MKLVLLSLLAAISFAISCSSQEYYIRVNKYSGPDGDKETYTISGMIGGVDTVVMEGSSVPSFTNVTVEQCISKSEDGTYTLLLKHSDDLSWSSKSLITIENEDGIIVFNGNTIGSTKSFTFTLNYLVPKGSSAYVRYTLEMAEWWRQEYVMESNWAVESFSATRTVDGNYLCRYEFDLPDKSNYSHLVIRVYYKVGVAVWFNSVPLFNDNLIILGDIYQWTVADNEYPDYVWQDIIVPGSLVVSQKNVLAFSYHFKLYEQVSVDDNFAIFAVYASNPYTQCTPLPLSIIASTGVSNTQERLNLIDRDETTSCLFYGAVTHVTFETTVPAIVSDYFIYRSGNDAANQWQLMNCQEKTWPCENWRLSSQKSESLGYSGYYSYYADESTNLPSSHFRLQLFATEGMAQNITVNEISLALCGVDEDSLMYPSRVVTAYQEVNITPEHVVTNATYRITPDLPASLTLDSSTGVISGSTTGLQSFNEYTVIQSSNGEEKKFVLIILLSEQAPTEAPVTEIPTTEVPVTESPEEPTTLPPSSTNSTMWIWIVVGVVVVVILVIVFIVTYRHKTLPAQKVTKPDSNV